MLEQWSYWNTGIYYFIMWKVSHHKLYWNGMNVNSSCFHPFTDLMNIFHNSKIFHYLTLRFLNSFWLKVLKMLLHITWVVKVTSNSSYLHVIILWMQRSHLESKQLSSVFDAWNKVPVRANQMLGILSVGKLFLEQPMKSLENEKTDIVAAGKLASLMQFLSFEIFVYNSTFIYLNC